MESKSAPSTYSDVPWQTCRQIGCMMEPLLYMGNTRPYFTLYVHMDVSYFIGEHSTVPCHLEFFIYLSSEIPSGSYYLISKH